MRKFCFLCLFLLAQVVAWAQKKPTIDDLAKLRFDKKASAVFLNDSKLTQPINDDSFSNGDLPVDSLNAIYMKQSDFTNIELTGTQDLPFFCVNIADSCHGELLQMNSFTLELLINNSTINRLDFANCSLQSLNIQNTKTRRLSLSEASVTKGMYISRNVYCDTLDLRSFVTNEGSILSVIATSKENLQPSLLLFDYGTRFDNLEIDLSKYQLQLDQSCDDCNNMDSYNTFFTTELAYFKTKGQDKNFETLYYLFREWQVKDANFITKVFDYYLPKEFYGFGLKKVLVLRATLILFILSVMIFLIFYPSVTDAYTFEINNSGAGNGWGSQLYKAFILTAIVFFSFKLEYKFIQFDKKFGLTIMMIVFSTGLICYAFLANFIFTFK